MSAVLIPSRSLLLSALFRRLSLRSSGITYFPSLFDEPIARRKGQTQELVLSPVHAVASSVHNLICRVMGALTDQFMPVTHPLLRVLLLGSLARVPPPAHLPSRPVILIIRLRRHWFFGHFSFSSLPFYSR